MTTGRFAWAAAIVLIAATSPLRAQSPVCDSVVVQTTEGKDTTFYVSRRDAVNAQLERSYITAKGGLGNLPILLFEGNIATHFVMREIPGRYGPLVVFTYKGVLRMLQGGSAPVRTPSYSPQVTAYFQIRDCSTLLVGVRHYSNGQEGAAVNGTAPNLIDGNFSTNFVEIGPVFAGIAYGAYVFVKPTVEWHFIQDSLEVEDYGQWRTHLQLLSVLAVPSPKKGLSTGSLIQFDGYWFMNSDRFEPLTSSALAFSLTWSIRPAFLEDFGLFVNAYWGRDYYNIWYERNLSVLRVGFMGDNRNFLFR